MLSFVQTYENSLFYMNADYTNYGNREFEDNNDTVGKIISAVKNEESFIYNKEKDYHWVSFDRFFSKIGKTYNEVNFDEMFSENLKNKFVSPNSVKENIETFLPKIKNFNKFFYSYISEALLQWKKMKIFPYSTVGFKIYSSEQSMLITKLNFEWKNVYGLNKNFDLYGIKSNEIEKWIHLDTNNNKYAVSQFANKNENYVNAIIPAEIARSLNLKLNSIY